MRGFLELLRDFNDNYSQTTLVVIALISAIFVYKEFVLHRRPYVVPEINFRPEGNDWFFDIVLVNKGERPGIAKITRAVLTIGDETYPTVFEVPNIVLSPQERKTLAPIGHIKESGRKKVIGHEYQKNRVEIEIEIMSRAIGEKEFPYRTEAVYGVDVTGTAPVIQILNSDIN